MLNYSLEVFYSPLLIDIYTKMVVIMAVFSTIFYLFILYAIVVHAHDLGIYRWLMLSSFTLSYVIDVSIAFGHPVIYLPALVFNVEGISAHYFGTKNVIIYDFIFVAEKIFSVALLNMYRFANCIPGRLQNFMEDRKNLLLLVVLCFLVGCVPILLVFVDFQTNNLDEFLIEEAPALLQLTFDENTVTIHRSPFFILLTAASLLTLIVGSMITLYIFIHMDRAIKQLKIKVTQHTYHLQRMLYLSVIIETLITDLTFVLPLGIFAIMIIFSIPYGSYVTHVSFIFIGFYTSLSVIAHVYFIKPFRKCAQNVFNVVVRFCIKRRDQVVFYKRSTVSIRT